jgi:serine/threonine protein kinase
MEDCGGGMDDESKLGSGELIGNAFQIQALLGKGSFGAVYKAVDIRTGADVAIKTEDKRARFPQLLYEARIMEQLQTRRGFPELFWYNEHRRWNVLVMQLLKTSLENDRVASGGTLSMSKVVNIALQGMECLRVLHELGWAYRDIKPDNFMWRHNKLYMIDFGLCKRVIYPGTSAHIARRAGKSLTGTPRYASVHAHFGEEQSRRDDLESFVYMLIYLANGSLPWQKLPPASSKTKDRYKHIGKFKKRIKHAELCAGLPSCFRKTLQYAQTLEFEDIPDYNFLHTLWKEFVC